MTLAQLHRLHSVEWKDDFKLLTHSLLVWIEAIYDKPSVRIAGLAFRSRIEPGNSWLRTG